MHAAADPIRAFAIATSALLCACSAPQSAAAPVGDAGASDAPTPRAGAGPRIDPRVLLRSATFGRLVQAARQADEASAGDSVEGCLLRPPVGPAGFRLTADLSLAVRPLPDPPADLDGLLAEGPGPVRPIAPWGRVGAAGEGPIVGSFTTLPPARGRRGLVVFLTDRGAYLRTTGEPGPTAGPLSRARAGEALALASREADVVIVTAEAGVRVADLEPVLAAVPREVPVGLGVTLPPDAILPEGLGPSEEPDDPAGLCSESPPPSGSAEGYLSPASVRSALAPLRPAGERCLAVSGVAGGALALRFRIDASGAVAAACAESDEAGSPRLRACVLEAVRGLRFPAPSPAGEVDVELPLALRVIHQLGLCEGGP